MPKAGEINYTKVIELDLSTITRSVAGPKRPQDRIELGNVKNVFRDFVAENKGKIESQATSSESPIKDGSVVIAAITSCTNTSNPSVLIAAGLLAKRAVEKA